MKIKIFFVVPVVILLIISFAEIFNIPPRASGIFPLYKSGYFTELDNEFRIIKDSFIALKSLSSPDAAWVYANDIQKKYKIDLKIYNRKGYLVITPDKKGDKPDSEIVEFIQGRHTDITSSITRGRYRVVIPVTAGARCLFCHEKRAEGDLIGIMTFERAYDSHVYYSAERVLIFLSISLCLIILLFFIVRWVPAKNIKELFDKS